MSTPPWLRSAAALLATPLPGKDLRSLDRAPFGAGLILGPIAVAALVFVVAAADRDLESLSLWTAFEARGRGVFVALVSLALFGQAVAVPLVGAVAIASERERGTWSALLTTSLTPGQIVVGKYLAVLGLLVPAHAAALPALAAAGFWGEVGVLPVVAAVLGLLAHAAAQAAVGLLASAMAGRVRRAVVLALVMGGAFVSFPLALPASTVIAVWASPFRGFPLAPTLALLVVLALALVPACLYAARSLVAPSALGRFAVRRPYRVALLVGLPVVLAALGAFFVDGGPGSSDEAMVLVGMTTVVVGLVLSLAVVVEVCTVPVGPSLRPDPTPAAAAREVTVLVGLGLAGAWPLLAQLAPHALQPWDAASSSFAEGGGPGLLLVFAGLGLAGLAGASAAVGRWVERPALRLAVVLLALLGILAAPVFGAAVSELSVGRDWLPLVWLNPVGMVTSYLGDAPGGPALLGASALDAVQGPFGVPGWLAGAAFWLAWAALGQILGRRRS